jgi:hypothetical protein
VGLGVRARLVDPAACAGLIGVVRRWPAPVTGWFGTRVGVSHPFAAALAAWSGSAAAGWTQSDARPAVVVGVMTCTSSQSRLRPILVTQRG